MGCTLCAMGEDAVLYPVVNNAPPCRRRVLQGVRIHSIHQLANSRTSESFNTLAASADELVSCPSACSAVARAARKQSSAFARAMPTCVTHSRDWETVERRHAMGPEKCYSDEEEVAGPWGLTPELRTPVLMYPGAPFCLKPLPPFV